jgi:DNA-binding response OmpR family regulator
VRVLVAAGDRDTVMTLGILLRSEGHEICSTACGEDIRDAVRRFKPHVVLFDVGMVGSGRLDLAQELLREHGSASPALVALAEHVDAEYRVRLKRSGFSNFIAKPYDSNQVLAVLERYSNRFPKIALSK